MTFGSVCSGIEAATVAWEPLGWTPAWFAEIDPFCSALLKYHYPEVGNHGDFTRIGRDAGPIDLLVGGTPCQAFSVAGLRGGLDDERGNLTLEFLALAGRLRPRWLVWENVPGVLSIDGGRTFGAVLRGLAKLGYGFAYRVLDAQYFGVPQRRRRVFVVGHLGDWRRAAAVLFECHSLSGHPAPSREACSNVAALTANGVGTCGADDNQAQAGHLLAFGGNNSTGPIDVASACNAHGGSGRMDFESETFIAVRDTVGPLTACGGTERKHGYGSGQQEVESGHVIPVVYPILEAGARTGKSTTDTRAGMGVGDASDPMFTLQAGKQHAIAFSCKDHGADAGDLAPTLRAMPHHGSHPNAGGQVAIAFTERGRDQGRTFEYQEEVAYCLTNPGSCGRTHSRQVMTPQMAVRRLTPRECERLQGFRDDYTLIPYRGKPAADGPRYKAIGNSMAVPVMRWIGRRIMEVSA